MPNACCIETYKKLNRMRDLVDHWKGETDLLVDENNLIDTEMIQLAAKRDAFYIESRESPDLLTSNEFKETIMRLETLNAHRLGKINLLKDKVLALQKESDALAEWIKDFPDQD